MVILSDDEYTIDATLKKITLSGAYTALSLGQIKEIRNITTGSTLWDLRMPQGGISISGAVISYTYDDSAMANTDDLRIEIDVSEGKYGVYQPQPFSAKAVDGSSATFDVSVFSEIGFTLTDAVCDGVLTVTDGFGAELTFTKDREAVTSITCAGSGTNYHHCVIVNARPKEIIFILTGRSTGAISVDMNCG